MTTLVEPLTTAILSKLQSELPAKLTAVDAEYDDGVSTPAPNGYYGYLKDPRLPNFNFPGIVVAALPAVPKGREVAGTVDILFQFVISYVSLDTDGNPEVLDKRLKRAGEAIARLVETSRHSGPGDLWEVVSLRYGEPVYLLDENGSALFAEMPVVVRVDNYEVLT